MGMLLSYHDGYRPEADAEQDADREPRKPRTRKAKAEQEPADQE